MSRLSATDRKKIGEDISQWMPDILSEAELKEKIELGESLEEWHLKFNSPGSEKENFGLEPSGYWCHVVGVSGTAAYLARSLHKDGVHLRDVAKSPIAEFIAQAVRELSSQTKNKDFSLRYVSLPQFQIKALWMHQEDQDVFKIVSAPLGSDSERFTDAVLSGKSFVEFLDQSRKIGGFVKYQKDQILGEWKPEKEQNEETK